MSQVVCLIARNVMLITAMELCFFFCGLCAVCFHVTVGVRRRTLQRTEADPGPLLCWDCCTSSATPCGFPPGRAPPAGCSGGCCRGGNQSSPSLLWWRQGTNRSGTLFSAPAGSPLWWPLTLGHCKAWSVWGWRLALWAGARVLTPSADRAWRCVAPPQACLAWTETESTRSACRIKTATSSSAP